MTYFNPEGRAFTTVKDIEMFFGAQVLKGQEIPEIAIARDGVQTDESGRVINHARREITETLTADDVQKPGEKRKRGRWGPDSYTESDSLIFLQVSSAADWSPMGVPGEDVKELQRSAAEIQASLVADRGFPEMVKVWVTRGCESERLQPALTGFFYQLTDAFNHRPVFQRIFKSSVAAAPLGCLGVYVFWSASRSKWTIGPLGDDDHAYAFAVTDAQGPAEPNLRWMMLKDPGT